ncbi:MAG TPA: DNA-formamidopyrimidine glycosylase family protein [Actinomycetota bacterium]|nr:DNA-formamidopyrimidine glycosylase family protein [Actinomycetota bacterium]
MPELPELHALSERLDDLLRGEVLTRVDVLHFSTLKSVHPAPSDVVGRVLEGTARRGKYVSLLFAESEIVFHFSQGGRLDLEEPPKTTKPRGALVRLVFGADRALLLREHGTERRAALWILKSGDEGPRAGLGPEPTDAAFADFLLSSDDTRQLHTILRDQRTVAGIGRGFADDILHAARLSPLASLRSLDAAERQRLLDNVRTVLERALSAERTRSRGLTGKLRDRFTVHGRHGSPCPQCGDTLRRVSYESREVAYCPACQTGGKILADRRLSRLLR